MRYRNLPTEELEKLLRRPDLPPGDQQAVEGELQRRYTEELLGRQAPVVAQQPVAPPPQAYAPPPVPNPVAPAPVPVQKPGSPALVGCVVAFLLVIAAGVVLAILNGASSGPETGNVCFVQGGSCPLAAAAPRGSSCYCSDGVNTAYGVVG